MVLNEAAWRPGTENSKIVGSESRRGAARPRPFLRAVARSSDGLFERGRVAVDLSSRTPLGRSYQ